MPPTSSIRVMRAPASRRRAPKTSAHWSPKATKFWCRSSRIRLGTKGARLTTYITLPSRYLVYMPQGRGVGVSARIEDERERERLRAAVRGRPRARGERRIHRAHRGRGRAARGVARRHDVSAQAVGVRARKRVCAPQPGNLVHADLPLHLRVLRDLLRPEVDRVLIDQPSAHREMQEFAEHVHARRAAAHRAVRRGAPGVRAAPRRGGDSKGPGSQGARSNPAAI